MRGAAGAGDDHFDASLLGGPYGRQAGAWVTVLNQATANTLYMPINAPARGATTTTAPVGATEGTLWFDPVTTNLFCLYNGQWVVTNNR